ncbi:hypothetical protein [Flagellimonas amoyensis]|uniref:hypothetical protein n=1 Tax=Flagellimonas amoyensis TaxID=2169401 RepID=UPI000D3CAD76|nr:hypothetical protein [Allomuricauda amoyensis]
MKKVIIILGIIGLGGVGVAYYFSLESLKVMDQVQEEESLNEVLADNKSIAEESAREELIYGNSIIYQSIDFTKPEYEVIGPCIQNFHTTGKLDALCLNEVLEAVVGDLREEGFINAVIGSSIDYENLALDPTFLDNLFSEQTSLANALSLGFLNRYRSPKKMQQAFDRYKTDLFNSVPKSLYQKVFERKVLECLSAYEEITGQANREAFFEDIYFKADTQNLHGQYWTYTFWKRREMEKNDKVLYVILTEIKNHYNKK